jgi:hypothetical protein
MRLKDMRTSPTGLVMSVVYPSSIQIKKGSNILTEFTHTRYDGPALNIV